MLLGLLILLPLVGVLAIMLAPPKQARWIALATTTITFLYSVGLAVSHDFDDGVRLRRVVVVHCEKA